MDQLSTGWIALSAILFRRDATAPSAPFTPADSASRVTCADYYAYAGGNSGWEGTNQQSLFGPLVNQKPLYPPTSVVLPASASDLLSLANERLAFEGHVLRAAGRLLHDLIRESVFADLAGAEQRRSQALDPKLGNQIAWGQADNADGPYDSIAHAVRVLAGRWELGSADFDPQCSGVPELDILTGAYGDDFQSRVDDQTPTTNGQVLACQLVEKAGVVVPQAAQASASVTTLRQAVEDALAQQLATTNGTSLTDPNVLSARAAWHATLTNTAEGDLRFALERSLRMYSLLTNVSINNVTLSPPTPGIVLQFGAGTNNALTQLGGNALAGGTGRSRLQTDVLSRAGGLLEASQCSDAADVFVASLPSTASATDPMGAPRFWSQDAFAVGQIIERRLESINQRVRDAQMTSRDADTVSADAVAEIRAWDGPGALEFLGPSLTQVSGTVLSVGVNGFQPADWGAVTPADMVNKISLVYGPPWVADCAAGLRDQCPDMSAYRFKANEKLSILQLATPTDRASLGATGVTGNLLFLKGEVPSNFSIPYHKASPSPSHLYVILDHDPTSPAGRGKVLAVLGLSFPVATKLGGRTATVVSSMQRELMNAVLGIGAWNGNFPTTLGEAPASVSPGYCIDGIPRDLFVPLENELTATSSDPYENSWEHYLTLAKEAATQADSLGQDLVRLGLATDLRREAAGEQLATICGDYSALQDLSADPDGKIAVANPSNATNAPLTTCLGESKIDIVTLGAAQQQNDGTLKALIHCGVCAKDSDCPSGGACDTSVGQCSQPANAAASDPLCSKQGLTTAGLNLAQANTPPGPDACNAILASAAQLSTGFDPAAFQSTLVQPWAQTDELYATALTTHLTVGLDDEWDVVSAGALLMSSRANSAAWPGCARSDTPAASCLDGRLASNLSQVYWSPCPAGVCQNNVAGPADLNAILWRVEGSLWMLGSITGRIPDSMFTVPVAVANFGALNGLAQIVTIYGDGPISKDASGNYSFPDLGPNDAHLMLGMNPVDARFGQRSHSDEVPAWLNSVYQNAGSYMHLLASNAEEDSRYSDIYATVANCGLGYPGPGTGLDSDYIGFFGYQIPRGGLTPWSSGGATGWLGALKTVQPFESNQTFNGVWTAPAIEPAEGGECGCSDPGDGNGQTVTCYAGAGGYGNHEISCTQNLFDVYGAGAYLSNVSVTGCAFGPWDSTYDDSWAFNMAPAVWLHYYNNPLHAAPGDSWNSQRGSDFRMNPSQVPPNSRVRAFVNSGPPAGIGAAASQFVSSVALSCLANNTGGGPINLSAPPSLKTMADLATLETWLGALSTTAGNAIGRLYLEQVPKRVVDDFNAGTVGSGSKKGTNGQIVLDIENSLVTLQNGLNGAAVDLETLQNDLKGARLEMAEAKIEGDQAAVNLAIQQLQVYASMAQAAGNVVSSIAGISGPLGFYSVIGASMASAGTVACDVAELGKLQDLGSLQGDQEAVRVSEILNELGQKTTTTWTSLENNLGNVRTAVGNLQKETEGLVESEQAAQYEAAKGMGQDFFTTADGTKVLLPVNTVNRRQYDATKLRYEAALKNARYLAFLARRAIEQRIGVRLDQITVPVGVLNPPAEWADDVCHMTGINYDDLKALDAPEAGTLGANATDTADQQRIREFADAFVGDYVEKLSNFVQYYNVEYPSHEANDTAILSLKDDLLNPSNVCTMTAANLLFYSGRLDQLPISGVDSGTDAPGWQRSGCADSAQKCLEVLPGQSLQDPTGPDGIARSGVTWLRDTSEADGGGADAGDAAMQDSGVHGSPVPGTPSAAVYQDLHLEAGTFVLSWWDEAVGGAGTTAGASPVAYDVVVLTVDSRRIAAWTGVPGTGDGGAGGWGPRNTLTVTVSEAGTYRVAFDASSDQRLGSVAIADVQLEAIVPGGLPTPYVAVESSRMVPSMTCPAANSQQLQNAFQRRCDGRTGECYYELLTPIVFDTTTLGAQPSRLDGKIARGNFNFRHVDVALNLVGTGVYDCSGSNDPNCYANGYVEYTLEHDAKHAGIMDWAGDIEYFSFGEGVIDHGKALSAERFITMPISANDQGLLSQPGIQHPELSGRPLDGNYRLRIVDSPALHWAQLQDVQLVLSYHYWSRVNAASGQ